MKEEEMQKEAVVLAEGWLSAIRKSQPPSKIEQIVASPESKRFVFTILDQAFRSKRSKRVTNQLSYLLSSRKIPSTLPLWQRALLKLFRRCAFIMPDLFVAVVKYSLRHMAKKWVFDADLKRLLRHVERRKKEGLAVNINYLGEAIISEEEAILRLNRYLHYIECPEIEVISIKISSLYSQHSNGSFQKSVEVLQERFRTLLRKVKEHPKKDGKYSCIHFDMEEYRDFSMTCEVFQKTLEEEEFIDIEAGLALQAYLPDSYAMAQKLASWARLRVARGGSPIKIRLVKGANLANERIEASIRGWKQAPYSCKADTDRNFVRMAKLFFAEENQEAITLGIASHNLFDLAWCYLMAKERGVEGRVIFEMLEGMAPSLLSIFQSLSFPVLLYCPVVEKKDFDSAVAYLFRRLDESCGKENFLTSFFSMVPGDAAWEREKEKFLNSFSEDSFCSQSPNRDQNRQSLIFERKNSFENEPDTDFSLPQNRAWAKEVYLSSSGKNYGEIPNVIGGKVLLGFGEKSLVYEGEKASLAQVEEALIVAKKRQKKERSVEENLQMLANAARLMRERRAAFISAMMVNTFKTFVEADGEVSEAVDFIEYYSLLYRELSSLSKEPLRPIGPVVVASPWNFPLSIPCGGITASLVSRNATLFKPAQEAILVGYLLAQLFWDAGFDREELQFLHCDDEPEGSFLIQDPRVERILLTGGTETAKKLSLLQGKKAKLLAETGGKNSLIVTSMADRDQAIRDIIISAFSNAGQKCSAASLLLLEKELYEDPHFLRKLAAATKSLICSSALSDETFVNPLIRPPTASLLRAITELEEGESWLVTPVIDPHDARKISPGIKLGVKKGSFTFTTEFFGPLLGIMPFASLAEAVEIVNCGPYGLTAGIESLDEREIAYWQKNIQAGNLYVNRPIVGAIVKREPFGGMKESQYGFGFKAGGPNSLLPLLELPESGETDDYEEAFARYFSGIRETCHLLGQRNLFWMVPREKIIFRLYPTDDSSMDIERVKKATSIAKTPLAISSIEEESDELFIKRLSSMHRPCVRILSDKRGDLIAALHQIGATLFVGRAHYLGRFEIPKYLQEVSFCHYTSRFGFIEENE